MATPIKKPTSQDSANSKFFLIAGGLTGMASRLASPEVVMPWIYSLIGGPLYLVGFLIPSLRIGTAISQAAIVPTLRKIKLKKWIVVYSCITLASMLTILCIATIKLSASAATIIFFACLLVTGACIGSVQLASQDLMAKTIPHQKIGPLVASQASIGGALTLAITSILLFSNNASDTDIRHIAIVIIAAVVWLMAGLSYTLIKEIPALDEKSRSAWNEIKLGIELCRNTSWFLKFFRTSALFLSVGLAMPFYAIHAASKHIEAPQNISLFVIATGLAAMASTPVWGKMLAKSPGQVFLVSGILAAIAGLIAMIEELLPSLPLAVVYAFVFFFLELAVQGMFQASKTYLATKSSAEELPIFIGANNTLLGIFGLVFSGFLGVLAHSSDILYVLIALVALSLVAACSAMGLESFKSN
jgi:hypothetical protein